MATTVVGIFDTLARAHTAVRELNSAGFGSDQISLIHRHPQSSSAAAITDRNDPDAAAARTGVTPDWGMASAGAADTAATASVLNGDADLADLDASDLDTADDIGPAGGAIAGAGTGVVIGGGLGLLAGAAGLFIPGLGPILGMGPMVATMLGGAGIGAVAGGLSGALVNAGVPETDAGHYAEGVRRGGTLVTVIASDQPTGDLAADVMDRAGAYDVNERAATWAESTAPLGGNTEVPALSTLPDSSMTADAPVVRI